MHAPQAGRPQGTGPGKCPKTVGKRAVCVWPVVLYLIVISNLICNGGCEGGGHAFCGFSVIVDL